MSTENMKTWGKIALLFDTGKQKKMIFVRHHQTKCNNRFVTQMNDLKKCQPEKSELAA